MNYTLWHLQQRVNKLIEQQGEDAHCAAWIYTKEDCHLKDENGEFDYDNVVEDSELAERIFNRRILWCIIFIIDHTIFGSVNPCSTMCIFTLLFDQFVDTLLEMPESVVHCPLRKS